MVSFEFKNVTTVDFINSLENWLIENVGHQKPLRKSAPRSILSQGNGWVMDWPGMNIHVYIFDSTPATMFALKFMK